MNLLSIAGSDPSSGAGIQGDMKTFHELGAYGLSVITAVTSQNTSRFSEVEPVSPSLVKSQIRSILEDFQVDAIKIGMVYDKQTVKAIHSQLEKIHVPIILDPIFESTTGGILQKDEAFSDFKKLLVPICHTITPNIMEAEKISNTKIRSLTNMKEAAVKIQKLGARNVVIKGGHFLKGDKVTDILLEDKIFSSFSHQRMKFESHGGGCTFSAALCANIAGGKKLSDAMDSARIFTLESIRNAKKIGKGLAIITPIKDTIEDQLSNAISEFCMIKSIYEQIPECQTNFVYSLSRPKTITDVMGLEGRIVRTGKVLTVAGNLKYGGSKHVASAVIEMARKFTTIRSGVNLRYDEKTIKNAIRKKMKVLSYDRKNEPQKNKEREGMTVSWGIKSSISQSNSPPDIIFHKGDIGKEAMLLVFGKNPTEVLKKVLKIVK